ncbi:hypothetical protein L1887_60019 [Cichorium endivia]|nr:hypothetical protein L1887_60019 [Cichorium endivia]
MVMVDAAASKRWREALRGIVVARQEGGLGIFPPKASPHQPKEDRSAPSTKIGRCNSLLLRSARIVDALTPPLRQGKEKEQRIPTFVFGRAAAQGGCGERSAASSVMQQSTAARSASTTQSSVIHQPDSGRTVAAALFFPKGRLHTCTSALSYAAHKPAYGSSPSIRAPIRPPPFYLHPSKQASSSSPPSHGWHNNKARRNARGRPRTHLLALPQAFGRRP